MNPLPDIGEHIIIVGDHPHAGNSGKVVEHVGFGFGKGAKVDLKDKTLAEACLVFRANHWKFSPVNPDGEGRCG